ncbi:hypothetical protein [Bosea thiooxidans]
MSQPEDGEVVVFLRQSVKRGGELMATYHMDYPNLAAALQEIGDDLKAGRVDRIEVGGRELSRQELAALRGSE